MMAAVAAVQERRMRQLIGIVLSLFLWPQLVAAQSATQPATGCAGTDLLAQMRTADPAAHAALFARAHAVPNGRGKFWRVSGNDLAPSYLFGTFHDTGVARRPLDPAVAQALGAARLMLVELTVDEQARMQARMASDPGFFIDTSPTGPTDLIGQLTATERSVLEGKLAANGLTLAIAAKFRPWMLLSLVGVPQCMLSEMQQGQPTLDSLLISQAAEAGIPVAGLETYEQALGGLAAIPADTMDEILLEGLRGLSGEEDARRTSIRLYSSGEIAAIWEFSIQSSAETMGMARSREIMTQMGASLLDARNRSWMKVLVPELAQGGVFAAFGAMHLVGDAGMIELLRAQGFEVTRLDG
jgi:uncharacterized protein YbaP (TraB family)